jgi:hypothetical protein
VESLCLVRDRPSACYQQPPGSENYESILQHELKECSLPLSISILPFFEPFRWFSLTLCSPSIELTTFAPSLPSGVLSSFVLYKLNSFFTSMLPPFCFHHDSLMLASFASQAPSGETIVQSLLFRTACSALN